MSLRKWIASIGGISACARLLGVSRSALHDWLSGRSEPTARNIDELVWYSKGKLTHKGLIRELCPRQGAERGRPL